MDVSMITNSLNMIRDMYAKPARTYKEHLDEFQKVFLNEMFTEEIVEGALSNESDEQNDGWVLYDNTIAKQLMSQLFTKQLVKQDALHIRSLMGRFIRDEPIKES